MVDIFVRIKYLEHVVSSEQYVERIQYDISGENCPEKNLGNKFW